VRLPIRSFSSYKDLELEKTSRYIEDRALENLRLLWISYKNLTREGHFILEFIQNAENTEASKIKIVLEKKLRIVLI